MLEISLNSFGDLTQRLLSPGQYPDAETRGADALSALTTLAHNHNRTYDPALGRYLTPDPVGLAGGLNRYAYVGGNPVRSTDSSGLNPAIDRRTGAIDLRAREYWRKQHLYRNCFNQDLPQSPSDAEALGWKEQPDMRNRYHRYDVNSPGDRADNVKWLSPDGHREVIFMGNVQPDFSQQNAGTYNFDGLDDLKHFMSDVIPFYMYGNGPPNPTACQCDSLDDF